MIVDPCSSAGRGAIDRAGSCRPLWPLTLPRRELDFPAGFSLGMLSVRGHGRRRTWSRARHGWGGGWREYVEARGRVRVPAGTQLKLRAMHLWPDPTALRCLGPRDLQGLTLGGLAASEDVLASLDHLCGLQQLDLWAAPVGNEVMPYVARLSHLKALALWGTRVTDAGFEALNPLGDLRSLTVPRQVGDRAMPFLAELDGLRELTLAGSRVTDAGIGMLSGARSLRRLSLWETQITDACLPDLLEFPFLAELDLGATAVTDQGVWQLAALPLRRLSLRDSLVSLEGLRALREELPRCRIEPSESEGCTWRPPTAGRVI